MFLDIWNNPEHKLHRFLQEPKNAILILEITEDSSAIRNVILMLGASLRGNIQLETQGPSAARFVQNAQQQNTYKRKKHHCLQSIYIMT